MYEWLKEQTGPRHMVEAIKLIGNKEIPGVKNNPIIMGWAKDLRIANIYTNDDTAWCGLFVGICLFKAGRETLYKYGILRAKDWGNYADKADKAEFGDILIFIRPGGGHVGFYVGEDADCYHVLGGNQTNMVNVTRIQKERCVAVRRVKYNNKPTNVKPILLAATGAVSSNEA